MNGQHPGRRRWWPLPVLAVLVIALGGGAGFGIRELAAARDGEPPTRSAAPTTVTTTPGDEPGSPVVRLAPDVVADQQSKAMVELLQRHFDAINRRDFDGWRRTVTKLRASNYPEPRWRAEYRSTTDGGILVQRIEPVQGGWVVLLSFTSTQEPELAPNRQSGCLHWRVSYLVVLERGEPRLGQSDPAASQYEAC